MRVKYKTWRKLCLEYMETDHWKYLREQKFKSGRSCFKCGSTKKIECHHIEYRNFTDCTTSDLIVLCKSCHDTLHAGLKSKNMQISQITEANCREFLDTCDPVVRKPRKPCLPKSDRRNKKRLRKKANSIMGGGIRKGQGIERLKEIIKQLQDLVDSEIRLDNQPTTDYINLMSIPSDDTLVPLERIPF